MAPAKPMRRFGAHMSIAGGLHLAFEAARKVGCDCMQVFVKNQRQWAAPPLTDEAIRLWRRAVRVSGIRPVIAHGSYLINLASPDATLWNRSIDAFVDELERCEALAIRGLVLHPGSHTGTGEAGGLRRVAQALNSVHRRTRGLRVRTLLETTAGQGTCLGHRFEHLAAIRGRVREPERIAVCLDTCHMFAAGYELTHPDRYAETIAALDRTVGITRVRCIHMNDSLCGGGAHVDRHAHIGKGRLGRRAFANLVRDPRFRNVPMILETPKGTDTRGRDLDCVNLATLRRLAR